MVDEKSVNLDAAPEVVAFRLMTYVLEAEGRGLGTTGAKLSRNLILDAYADCLEAVLGKRERRVPRRLL